MHTYESNDNYSSCAYIGKVVAMRRNIATMCKPQKGAIFCNPRIKAKIGICMEIKIKIKFSSEDYTAMQFT